MNGPRTRSRARRAIANPMLVGAAILMVAGIGLVLTYNASRGLPFVPTYDVKVDVPDAAELIAGASEVRLGGARIGIVDGVDAVPATPGHRAFARLSLKLHDDQPHLPLDTTVQVRPRSILGAKYVDVRLGRSRRTLPAGGELPLRNAIPAIELDEAFEIFDDRTSRGLRGVINELGDGLAGRGADLNQTIAGISAALPPLQRVLGVLASPDTQLGAFIRAAARASAALAPVAPQLGGLVNGAARTFGALDAAGPALGRAVAALPSTETVGTRTLRRIAPVLDDAAAIGRAIRPGTRELPGASRELARTLRTGTPVLARTPPFADRLGQTFAALGTLAKDPNANGSLRQLIDTVGAVGTTLDVLEPAQLHCNVAGIWSRNLQDTLAGGNSLGNHLNGELLVSVQQLVAGSGGASDLHSNPLPNENADECESGHEPFPPGRHIGNPPGLQKATVPQTHPPAPATSAARAAGLLRSIPGAAR